MQIFCLSKFNLVLGRYLRLPLLRVKADGKMGIWLGLQDFPMLFKYCGIITSHLHSKHAWLRETLPNVSAWGEAFVAFWPYISTAHLSLQELFRLETEIQANWLHCKSCLPKNFLAKNQGLCIPPPHTKVLLVSLKTKIFLRCFLPVCQLNSTDKSCKRSLYSLSQIPHYTVLCIATSVKLARLCPC